MSTQMEREAAARALAAANVVGAGQDAAESALDCVIDAPDGWWLPDGTNSATHAKVRAGGWIDFDEAAGLWLAHVRALDAANAAPVAPDPLEGVVWEDPCTVVVIFAHESWPSRHITERDDTAQARLHKAGVTDDAIAAHARAQLAREAKAAPVAVTLEDARRMCREAGDTVVTASGYERPDLALVQTEAWEAMSQADRARLAKALGGLPVSEIRDTQGRIESRRLRALGVVPAVLK